jgi:hypothetical protein
LPSKFFAELIGRIVVLDQSSLTGGVLEIPQSLVLRLVECVRMHRLIREIQHYRFSGFDVLFDLLDGSARRFASRGAEPRPERSDQQIARVNKLSIDYFLRSQAHRWRTVRLPGEGQQHEAAILGMEGVPRVDDCLRGQPLGPNVRG